MNIQILWNIWQTLCGLRKPESGEDDHQDQGEHLHRLPLTSADNDYHDDGDNDNSHHGDNGDADDNGDDDGDENDGDDGNDDDDDDNADMPGFFMACWQLAYPQSSYPQSSLPHSWT